MAELTAAQSGQSKAPKTTSTEAKPGEGTGKTQTWWQANGQRAQFFIDEKKYSTIIYTDMLSTKCPKFDLIGMEGETLVEVQEIDASTKKPVPAIMYNRVPAGKLSVKEAIPCFYQDDETGGKGIPLCYTVQPEISFDEHSERLHLMFWANVGCRLNESKDNSDAGTTTAVGGTDAKVSGEASSKTHIRTLNVSLNTNNGMTTTSAAGGASVFVPCFKGIDCKSQPEKKTESETSKVLKTQASSGTKFGGTGASSKVGHTGEDTRGIFTKAKEPVDNGGPSAVLRPLQKNIDRTLFHCIADPIPVSGIRDENGVITNAPWDVVYIFHRPYEILTRNGPINEIVSTAIIVDNEDIINRPDCSFDNVSTRIINGNCDRETDTDDLFVIDEWLATKGNEPGGPETPVTTPGTGNNKQVVVTGGGAVSSNQQAVNIAAGALVTQPQTKKTTTPGKTGDIDNRLMIWVNENKTGQPEENVKGGFLYRRKVEITTVNGKKTSKVIEEKRGLLRDLIHIAEDNHAENRTCLHWIYQEKQHKAPVQKFSGPLAFTPEERFQVCKTPLKILGSTITGKTSGSVWCDYFSGSNYWKKFSYTESDPADSCVRGDDKCGGKHKDSDGTRSFGVPGFWHPTIEIPLACNVPTPEEICKIAKRAAQFPEDPYICGITTTPGVPTRTPSYGTNPPGATSTLESSPIAQPGLTRDNITGTRTEGGKRISTEFVTGEGPSATDNYSAISLDQLGDISDDRITSESQTDDLGVGTNSINAAVADEVDELDNIVVKELVEQTGKVNQTVNVTVSVVLGSNVSLQKGIGVNTVKFHNGTGTNSGHMSIINSILKGEETYQEPDSNGLPTPGDDNKKFATEDLNFVDDPISDFSFVKVFGKPDDTTDRAGATKIKFTYVIDLSKIEIDSDVDKPIEYGTFTTSINEWIQNAIELFIVTINRCMQFVKMNAKETPYVALGACRVAQTPTDDQTDSNGVLYQDEYEWAVSNGPIIDGTEYKCLTTTNNGNRSSFGELPPKSVIDFNTGNPNTEGYETALFANIGVIVLNEKMPPIKLGDVGVSDIDGANRSELYQLVSAFQNNIKTSQQFGNRYAINATPDAEGKALDNIFNDFVIPAGSYFPKNMPSTYFIDVVGQTLKTILAWLEHLDKLPRGVMLAKVVENTGTNQIVVREIGKNNKFITTTEHKACVGDSNDINIDDVVWCLLDQNGELIAHMPPQRETQAEQVDMASICAGGRRIPASVAAVKPSQIIESDIKGTSMEAIVKITNTLNDLISSC